MLVTIMLLVVTVLIESSRYRGPGQSLQRVYDAVQKQ